MSSILHQTSRPFACRQCEFCKEAFRVDGGASGIESPRHSAWFCSGGCLQLANLFKSSPGNINEYARDSLIKTYNNCYTYISKDGEYVHIPRKNEETTENDIRRGDIYLIKSIYEDTTDDNHFGKYN